MKKVLLIEDRYIRQKFFMDETGINLESYGDVLDNFINEQYDELELQIENDNFDFDKYDYIISHKSAFGKKNSDIIGKLKDYCTAYKKTLILFSGGIATNYYDKSEFEILELNSKTFYSKDLELFLEATRNNEEEVLMLCYGLRWKKNMISNKIENINIFLDKNEDEDLSYSDFIREVDIKNIENIYDDLYTVDTKDGWVYRSEIIKLRSSFFKHLSILSSLNLGKEQNKSLLVHNNNIASLEQFDNSIKFIPDVSDIDGYISKKIILELRDKALDIVYIKDNLSPNYLELYGLRVAYHIRLSEVLEDKRYIPIVIMSDLGSEILNGLDPLSRILFTKNIFLIENTKEAIEKTKTIDFTNLTPDEYEKDFLDKIKVEQPKDYLTHHSIANEWSMYRWAEYLNVNTPDIEKIRDDISSMLYFKYLQAKFPIKKSWCKNRDEANIEGRGKVLYIDDEWEKGWKSIFEHLSLENQDYSLETVEEVYKDKAQEEIITFIMAQVVSVNPDVVILDMRLHEDDFLENVKLADFTGIQIFNQIKEINPGIQVIIFTASNNSLLLDELYSYDSSILGYVKKEHPKNYNLTTQGNIDKIIHLLNQGLEKKYLKEVFSKSHQMNEILNSSKFESSKYLPILIFEINSIFDILDSNTKKRFIYAALTIVKCFETISNMYILDKKYLDNQHEIKLYNDNSELVAPNTRERQWRRYSSLENKLHNIFIEKFEIEAKYVHINICQFMNFRNNVVHPNVDRRAPRNCERIEEVDSVKILLWFNILFDAIEKMKN